RLLPGGRIVSPAAAQHGGDDLYSGQLLRGKPERITVEHDEVGQETGEELAAAVLVPREPRRIHSRGLHGFCERDALLRMPRAAVVDRAQDTGADAGPGIELLD